MANTRRSSGPTAGRVTPPGLAADPVVDKAAISRAVALGMRLWHALSGGGLDHLREAAAGGAQSGLAVRSLRALGIGPAVPPEPRLPIKDLRRFGTANVDLTDQLLRTAPDAVAASDVQALLGRADRIGNSVRQMPVAELNAHRDDMHALLDGNAWAAGEVADHLKSLPANHPVRQAAEQARLETHALVGQTRVRWAAANVGNRLLRLVGAPFMLLARKLGLLPPESASA